LAEVHPPPSSGGIRDNQSPHVSIAWIESQNRHSVGAKDAQVPGFEPRQGRTSASEIVDAPGRWSDLPFLLVIPAKAGIDGEVDPGLRRDDNQGSGWPSALPFAIFDAA